MVKKCVSVNLIRALLWFIVKTRMLPRTCSTRHSFPRLRRMRSLKSRMEHARSRSVFAAEVHSTHSTDIVPLSTHTTSPRLSDGVRMVFLASVFYYKPKLLDHFSTIATQDLFFCHIHVHASADLQAHFPTPPQTTAFLSMIGEAFAGSLFRNNGRVSTSYLGSYVNHGQVELMIGLISILKRLLLNR